MAIDNEQKRRAALGIGLPPGIILPPPSGSLDDVDRAILAGVYPVEDDPGGGTIDTPSKRRRALGFGFPPGVIVSPAPDGTIDATDRAGLAALYYPGIEPIPPIPPTPPRRGSRRTRIPATVLVLIQPGVIRRGD